MNANAKFILLLPVGLLLFLTDAQAQMPIRDRAIIAQQERMVFRQWDNNRFYPRPNRFLGIPTNPNWYLTWAMHPNYPNLDRRPLSPSGEQTLRMGLAAAMKISSDYYKQQTDTVRNMAMREMTRIAGALSGADPLYLLYYKTELAPLDNIEGNAFEHSSPEVRDYMLENGAYAWYLEHMQSLAERYGMAKKLDMERGQRMLMYHRILLEMRKIQSNWEYKLSLSQKMLAFRERMENVQNRKIRLSGEPAQQDDILSGILQRRIQLR